MRFVVADPRPGTPLADIESLAVRVSAWLARVSLDPAFPADRSVQIVGAVHFVEGLEYHYQSYMAHVAAATDYFLRVERHAASLIQQGTREMAHFPFPSSTEQPHLEALNHEAIAYLNRLGQFYYFARNLGRTVDVPRTSHLMSFRNKHVAHRSIDAPRNEDEAHLRMQAMAFGFSRLTLHGVLRFQIVDGGEYKEFCMPIDHPVIMQEAAALFLACTRYDVTPNPRFEPTRLRRAAQPQR